MTYRVSVPSLSSVVEIQKEYINNTLLGEFRAPSTHSHMIWWLFVLLTTSLGVFRLEYTKGSLNRKRNRFQFQNANPYDMPTWMLLSSKKSKHGRNTKKRGGGRPQQVRLLLFSQDRWFCCREFHSVMLPRRARELLLLLPPRLKSIARYDDDGWCPTSAWLGRVVRWK